MERVERKMVSAFEIKTRAKFKGCDPKLPYYGGQIIGDRA